MDPNQFQQIWRMNNNPVAPQVDLQQNHGIGVNVNPFPVSAGFLLSWVMGFHQDAVIWEPTKNSVAWGLDWHDVCRMFGSGLVELQPIDIEILHSSFGYISFDKFLV